MQAVSSLAPAPIPLRIRRLILTDFRSYSNLDLSLDAPQIALTGENGVGKTNALEALSMFTPGRGLRRADFTACARIGGSGAWTVAVKVERGDEVAQLGTSFDSAGEPPGPRRNRINGAAVASSGAFADYLRLVWLTPEMDGLFNGAPGERRRFLDRVVLSLDARHAARVAALERAARGRNRLLEDGARDAAFLDAIEREIAGLGVAVAAARFETVERLRAAAARASNHDSLFPWAVIELTGDIEQLTPRMPAVDLEERLCADLRASRERDASARRAHSGLRPADLRVFHGPKGVPAEKCSTGEQKALLVRLVLAQAQLVAAVSGMAPVVLLDEIGAHFDPQRRAALFSDLAALGGQVWMTGADPAPFADLSSDAEIYVVKQGVAEALATPPKRGRDVENASRRPI